MVARLLVHQSYLNRGRSACHHSQLIVCSMTSEFYQDVNLIFSDHASNFFLINPIDIPPDPTLFQNSISKFVGFCICLQHHCITVRKESYGSSNQSMEQLLEVFRDTRKFTTAIWQYLNNSWIDDQFIICIVMIGKGSLNKIWHRMSEIIRRHISNNQLSFWVFWIVPWSILWKQSHEAPAPVPAWDSSKRKCKTNTT